LSIMHGWVAWERGEEADNSKGPEQDIMVPAHLPMPAADSLPKLVRAQRYEQQFSFSMVCLTGEDKGEQVLYKTASVGGVAEVDKVLNAISAQLDEDGEKPVPCVTLDVDSYNHKKYKKTYTPVFTIEGWKELSNDLPDIQKELDEQGGDETEEKAPEQPKEEAKPARKRAASVPKTGGNKAADEDPELAALEAAIAAKKAAKDKGAKVPADDAAAAKARRMAELQAQLEALGAEDGNGDGEGDDEGSENPAADATVAGNQPIRRRRNA
jgi:hypothetical protein